MYNIFDKKHRMEMTLVSKVHQPPSLYLTITFWPGMTRQYILTWHGKEVHFDLAWENSIFWSGTATQYVFNLIWTFWPDPSIWGPQNSFKPLLVHRSLLCVFYNEASPSLFVVIIIYFGKKALRYFILH